MSNHPLFSGNLQELWLHVRFPVQFQDFSFCQNIPLLDLSHSAKFDGLLSDYPTFPTVYYGRNISLGSFNVVNWVRSVLPNVEISYVSCCLHYIGLPEMPKLQNLSINHCGIPEDLHIHEIRHFPLLVRLTVYACQKLERINLNYPNLMEATIVECFYVKDVSGVTTVRKLEIFNCPRLTVVPSLRNIKDLRIKRCEVLSELSHLNWSDFPEVKRTVNLSELPRLRDFSFCKNIFSLELEELPGLANCHGIENVREHRISYCRNLVTTEGLVNITWKLSVRDCRSLRCLSGVQGIPVLEISFCPTVNDFDSLRNHELVRIWSCRGFDQYLKEYQKKNKHEEVFSTIQHLRLSEDDLEEYQTKLFVSYFT
jgi:hypothetical protein